MHSIIFFPGTRADLIVNPQKAQVKRTIPRRAAKYLPTGTSPRGTASPAATAAATRAPGMKSRAAEAARAESALASPLARSPPSPRETTKLVPIESRGNGLTPETLQKNWRNDAHLRHPKMCANGKAICLRLCEWYNDNRQFLPKRHVFVDTY